MSQNIDKSVYIGENVVLDGNITIGEDSSIWHNAVLRTGVSSITIGKRSNVQDLCCFHCSVNAPVVVGDDVSIGHSCIIHGCTIGNRITVGMGSIIMDGAVIGDGCYIGAHTLITKGMVIPEGMLVYGSPAKIVRPVGPSEIEDNRIGTAEYVVDAKEKREGK